MLTPTALALLAVLAPVTPSASTPPAAPLNAGQVRLPLRDYLTMIEKTEAAEAARLAALTDVEPAVAEVVAQRLSLTLNEDDAHIDASYEVEVRGRLQRSVVLPLNGLADRITVEPAGTPAAVAKSQGVLLFVPSRPGRYRVAVSGRVALDPRAGAHETPARTFEIAPMNAPVAEVEVSLPATRAWRCPGAIVADDTLKEGRRVLRLALPRGQGATFEVRRDLRPVEPVKPLTAAVVVTILALGREGPRRHDIVLYEVTRGELGTMTLTLPPGLEPERIVTDEGEVTPWVEGRELRVERSKKLTTSGYLAIVSQPTSRPSIPLVPVQVDTKVRARYLAVASDVAATLTPEPPNAWTRVDLGDLPEPVSQVAERLGLVAAWRLRRDDTPAQLTVATMPAPQQLEGLVRSRTSLTLLTVEGTLLHRDRFSFEGEGAAFEIGLPAGGTLWSASVNDVPVRPLTRDGRTLIPLGLGAGGPMTIETVIVQEQAIPPGRSELGLSLPEVATPVLAHEWRLLLPERNRYRFLAGELEPPRPEPGERARAPQRGPRAVSSGGGGSASVTGVVTDPTGAVIPGASVTLSDQRDGRRLRLTTDAAGEFAFLFLPAGVYDIEYSMAGFKTGRYRVTLSSSRSVECELRMNVGDLTETISTAGDEPPHPSARGRSEKKDAQAAQNEEQRRELASELSQLKQGLVGGVKPLPVEIPETGKLLVVTGVLPPVHVSVTLASKSPKD